MPVMRSVEHPNAAIGAAVVASHNCGCWACHAGHADRVEGRPGRQRSARLEGTRPKRLFHYRTAGWRAVIRSFRVVGCSADPVTVPPVTPRGPYIYTSPLLSRTYPFAALGELVSAGLVRFAG